MKAKFVKENYPTGAEYDPKAPWNESDLDKIVTVNQYDEVELIKRGLNKDEGEEEKQTIDGYKMNQFLAAELNLDFEEMEEEGGNIEIIEIEEMSNGSYDIFTTHGNVNVFFEELENLV